MKKVDFTNISYRIICRGGKRNEKSRINRKDKWKCVLGYWQLLDRVRVKWKEVQYRHHGMMYTHVIKHNRRNIQVLQQMIYEMIATVNSDQNYHLIAKRKEQNSEIIGNIELDCIFKRYFYLKSGRDTWNAWWGKRA